MESNQLEKSGGGGGDDRTNHRNGDESSSIMQQQSATKFRIWAKERENYVTPLRIVAFQIKSPSKFGWQSSPRTGFEDGRAGVLCSIDRSTLMKYRPISLEITESDAPFDEFLTTTKYGDGDFDDEFFQRLVYLRIYETNAAVDHLIKIIDASKSLTVAEIFESQLMKEDRRRILDALLRRTELKAFDFAWDFDEDEMQSWMNALRLKLRFVRLSGPPALKLSMWQSLKVEMSMVEFVALQDLNVDIAQPEQQPSPIVVKSTWQWKMFNRYCNIFPNLKYFFIDFKVFDTIFIYDDQTKAIFEAIGDFFKYLRLTFMAILIYAPDDDMKNSVEKAAKYLVDQEIRTEIKEFFCGSLPDDGDSPPSNFRLLVLGDQVHTRTVRLIDTIVAKRNTNPDLRHFSYIMDADAFMFPNSTLAFGGFDGDRVEKMYNEEHVSLSAPEFVPDSVMARHMQG